MRKYLIVMFVFLNSVAFSESDSLSQAHNWNKNHALGLELGGAQFPYSVFYEFSLIKNKHAIGMTYQTGLFKFYSPLTFSNGIYFKYSFGNKNKIQTKVGSSLFVESDNFNSDFGFKLSEDKVEFYSFSLFGGYIRQINRFSIGVNTGVRHLVFYNILFPEDSRIRHKNEFLVGIELKYTLKK